MPSYSWRLHPVTQQRLCCPCRNHWDCCSELPALEEEEEEEKQQQWGGEGSEEAEGAEAAPVQAAPQLALRHASSGCSGGSASDGPLGSAALQHTTAWAGGRVRV